MGLHKILLFEGKEMKMTMRQARNWQKTFTTYLSGTGLISRIYISYISYILKIPVYP